MQIILTKSVGNEMTSQFMFMTGIGILIWYHKIYEETKERTRSTENGKIQIKVELAV